MVTGCPRTMKSCHIFIGRLKSNFSSMHQIVFHFSDNLIIFGIQMFVFLLTAVILLAEILSGGVGTFLLFNLLTGTPLNSQTMKGFSEKVLSGMFYKRQFLKAATGATWQIGCSTHLPTYLYNFKLSIQVIKFFQLNFVQLIFNRHVLMLEFASNILPVIFCKSFSTKLSPCKRSQKNFSHQYTEYPWVQR